MFWKEMQFFNCIAHLRPTLSKKFIQGFILSKLFYPNILNKILFSGNSGNSLWNSAGEIKAVVSQDRLLNSVFREKNTVPSMTSQMQIGCY